jgi:hypothetical protein
LQVAGDIINTGTFKLSAAAHSARIELVGDTTFSGSGAVITLSDGTLIGDVSTVAGSTITTFAETNNAINAEPGNERRILGPPLTTANAGKIVVVDNSQLDLGGLVANTGTIAVNASSHARKPR